MDNAMRRTVQSKDALLWPINTRSINMIAAVMATNPLGLTATFTLTITVTAGNEPPVFSPTSCVANVEELQVRSP